MKIDMLASTGDQDKPMATITAHRTDGRDTVLYIYESLVRPGQLVVDVEGDFDERAPDDELRVVVNERTAQVFG